MTKEELNALQALAEKATPGPWTAKDAPGAGLEIYADVPQQLGMPSRDWPAFSTANADCKENLIAYETWVQFPSEKLNNVQAWNAAYIAAANPQTILSLIARIRELEGDTGKADREAMVLRAARALSDRCAEVCNINKEDNWTIYSEDYIADAMVAFDAAISAGRAAPEGGRAVA